MSRETVVRFRATDQEKADATKKAKDRGFASLSDLVRHLLGFPTRSETPSSTLTGGATSRKAKVKKSAAKSPAKKPVAPAEAKKASSAEPPRPATQDDDEGPGKKAIEELAFRLSNREGLTSKAAKSKAKKMLEGTA